MTGHQFSYDYGEHVEGAGNYTVVVTANRDASITEMVSAFRAYLIAVGYHPDSVNGALGDE